MQWRQNIRISSETKIKNSQLSLGEDFMNPGQKPDMNIDRNTYKEYVSNDKMYDEQF